MISVGSLCLLPTVGSHVLSTPVHSSCSRSTPCPSVKHGDEWGEPSRCDGGDSCQYCHSRTEQQFHPEVGIGQVGAGHLNRGLLCVEPSLEGHLGLRNTTQCTLLDYTEKVLNQPRRSWGMGSGWEEPCGKTLRE